MLLISRINKKMKKLGLRTKLDFRFNTTDENEVPVLDFTIDDPIEDKKEIKLISRKKRRIKKNKNLF